MTEQNISPAAQGKRYALVIGVNTASGSGKSFLQWAEQDAIGINQTLTQSYCRFDDVEKHIGNEASTNNVRNAIRERLLSMKEQDSLLLYFAGHAIKKEISLDEQTVFLVTSDFSASGAKADPTGYITLEWLRSMAYTQTQAHNVIMMLDCCYSGSIGESSVSADMQHFYDIMRRFFNLEGRSDMPMPRGLRRIFAAASADQEAPERNGRGVMTGLIQDALSGKALPARNDQGEVTVARLYTFLTEHIPEYEGASLQYYGTDDKEPKYVLAFHASPSSALAAGRPILEYYVPRLPSSVYQERPHEIEDLLKLIMASPGKPIGLVGITGIGKSQLAVRVAQRYNERYQGRVYWIHASGSTREEWRDSFAVLARQLSYRPDPAANDPETLATYMANYLARQTDVLLILDDVKDPQFVTRFPTSLAGIPLQCAIMFTSIPRPQTDLVITHDVHHLANEQAWRLLLPSRYTSVLERLQANIIDEETKHAANICQYLGNHPMALDCMRTLLLDDEERTLADLIAEMHRVGILALSDEVPAIVYPDERTLRKTLEMVWNRVKDPLDQQCFKLATLYPDTTAIPLWQLAIAIGIGPDDTYSSRAHKIALRLSQLNLIDYLRESRQLQMHPLVRDFGNSLVYPDHTWLEEAGHLIESALEDIALLKQRAQMDYWICLEQVRTAISYIRTLTSIAPQKLTTIERYLDQESYLLATKEFWPTRLPALFHQQFHNRSIEENFKLREDTAGVPWFALQRPVGLKRQLEGERTFSFPGGPVTAVAFSPVAREILLGSEDGSVRLLNVDTGYTLYLLDGHVAAITAVVFSLDGSYLLTASNDHTIRLWYWQRTPLQCRYLRSFTHSSEVISAAISPDARFLLGGLRDGTAWLWERTSEQPAHILNAGHIVTGVAFVPPNGTQLLTVTSNMTIQLWDRDSGHPLQRTGLSKEIRWDAHSYGKLSYQLKHIPTGEIVEEQALPGSEPLHTFYCLACSSNGEQFLTGANNGTAHLWETNSGRLLHTFAGHQVMITSVAFSPNGECILTGSGDGSTRLWELNTRQPRTIFQQPARVTGVAFASDGQQILTGMNTSQARLWNVPAQPSTSIQQKETQPVTSIALNIHRNYLYALVGTANGEALLWHYERERDEWRVRRRWQAQNASLTSTAIANNIDRFLLLTASEASNDGIAILWEAMQKPPDIQLLRSLALHTDGISTTLFSPDRESLLIASFDGTIRLWKIREQQDARKRNAFRVLEATNRLAVHCAAISSDGQLIVGGMSDGQIKLWPISQRKNKTHPQERVWPGHTNQVTCVTFLLEDRFILSSALDGTTRLWNTATGIQAGELAELHEEIEHATSSPNGQWLLTCDRRGNYARLWAIEVTNSTVNCTLRGLYPTSNRIGAAMWLNNHDLILGDTGGNEGHPYFYHLRIVTPGI